MNWTEKVTHDRSVILFLPYQFPSLAMNGAASASNTDQSLLHHPTNDDAGPADLSGAGSTDTSHNDLQHSHNSSSPDQDPSATNATNIFPDEPSSQSSQPSSAEDAAAAESGDVTQASQVISEEHEKGDGADPDNVQAEHMLIKEEGEVLLEHVNGHIELLDNPADQGVGSSQAGYVADEGQEWITDADHELKRVKVRRHFHLFILRFCAWTLSISLLFCNDSYSGHAV